LYVENIKKYLPTHNVKGISIFKDAMIDDGFSDMNQRLFSFDQFMTYLEKQDTIYSESALNEAKSKIKKYIVAA
jgi:hypothetical protein